MANSKCRCIIIPVKTCTICTAQMPPQTKAALCRQCAGICACGARKDYRARSCDACGRAEKAKLQWANKDIRAKMVAAIQAAGRKRRVVFDDLTEESFTEARMDGRRYAWYWKDDNAKHSVYRYQWRWIKQNGSIPKGYAVHHKDGDCTNDSLDNLEIKTFSAHSRHHHAEHSEAIPKAKCAECGKLFLTRKRGNAREKEQQHCSLACRWEKKAQAKAALEARPCRRCGISFTPRRVSESKKGYCSMNCRRNIQKN